MVVGAGTAGAAGELLFCRRWGYFRLLYSSRCYKVGDAYSAGGGGGVRRAFLFMLSLMDDDDLVVCKFVIYIHFLF